MPQPYEDYTLLDRTVRCRLVSRVPGLLLRTTDDQDHDYRVVRNGDIDKVVWSDPTATVRDAHFYPTDLTVHDLEPVEGGAAHGETDDTK